MCRSFLLKLYDRLVRILFVILLNKGLCLVCWSLRNLFLLENLEKYLCFLLSARRKLFVLFILELMPHPWVLRVISILFVVFQLVWILRYGLLAVSACLLRAGHFWNLINQYFYLDWVVKAISCLKLLRLKSNLLRYLSQTFTKWKKVFVKILFRFLVIEYLLKLALKLYRTLEKKLN